ncbi:ABC transporter substrate-binding protein [Candidatus Chlorohelix sp.]|uniref:ABC transporter substrate-binding protein n=1 Tax=Candidatus Chlorohelix sp. TaxID=3139201 RepID=UPI0030303324
MTVKFKKNAIVLALVLLASLLLAACGDSSATPAKSGEATKVPIQTLSLALDWVPNTNHTGIYVALAKGWYAEAGIDLKILPYSEAATPESLIAGGKAELGIGSAESIAGAAAAGQALVSIAGIIQKDTSALVTLKSAGLISPKMLVGKKYAGFGATYEEPVINSMIKFDGGNGTFENITANVFGYEAVLNKQADFVWIFEGWDGIEAKLRGIDLNVIPITKYGVPDRYTPVIETSADVISKKGDALKRFMAATARGYDYAIANPKDAADLLINSNPAGTFSNKELVYKSQDYLSPKYKEGATQWGSQTLKMWTDYPKFMYQVGILKDADNKPLTKELDYNKLFSNEFLPKS